MLRQHDSSYSSTGHDPGTKFSPGIPQEAEHLGNEKDFDGTGSTTHRLRNT